MRIKKHLKLEKLTEKTGVNRRFATDCIQLDAENNRAVVTNGMALASVKVEAESGEQSGLVRAAIYQAAKKRENLVGDCAKIELDADGMVKYGLDTSTVNRASGEFPDYTQVLPKAGVEYAATTRLNPKLLLATIEAIGANCPQSVDKTPMIEIKIPAQEGAPIVIEYGENVGVVMPLRREEVE